MFRCSPRIDVVSRGSRDVERRVSGEEALLDEQQEERRRGRMRFILRLMADSSARPADSRLGISGREPPYVRSRGLTEYFPESSDFLRSL